MNSLASALPQAIDDGQTNQSMIEASRLKTEQLLQAYYLAVRALATGAGSNQTGPSRRGLPRDLICRICSLANYSLPSRALSQVSDEVMIVSARDSERTSIPWFQTPPLTREVLGDIVAIQLITDSHDQGWTSVPGTSSYSWFGIRIIQSDDQSLMGSIENQEREWESHSNQVASTDISRYEGRVFDHNHEIWTHRGEGDYLEVTANAQYTGWQNYAEQGMLQVFTRWQPSKAVLDMICPPESSLVIRPPPAASRTSSSPVVPPQVQSQASEIPQAESSPQAAPPNSQPSSAPQRSPSITKRFTSRISGFSGRLMRRIRGSSEAGNVKR